MQSKKNFIVGGKLKKQRVVLTNAVSRMGTKVANSLAETGAQLLLLDKDEAGLVALAEQLPSGREEHQVFALDITKPVEIEQIAKKISGIYDQIDVLINLVNVGGSESRHFVDSTTEQWQKIFVTKVYAPHFLTKSLLSALQKSPQPMVINVGSVIGKMPHAERSIDASAYFALRGLSLSLSREFVKEKVGVCHLVLGEQAAGQNLGERLVKMLSLGGLSDEVEWLAE